MKKRSILALLAALALMLSACSHPASDNDPVTTEDSKNTDTTTGTVSTGDSQAASSDLFTDRDFRTEYEDGIAITLSGSSAACDDKSVEISGSTITIKDEGTYVLSGKLDDGMVIVDTDKNTKVQLVLNGADISSETSAPIYILQADKVFITLAEGSENALSNGGTFTAIDENNIDSVIFSKDDLTLNGSGSLTITSPAGHGIVSKDELTITGKDNVCIAGGSFAIVSGKDGIQADNDEDTSLGFLHIQGGTFDIDAEGDGLSASGYRFPGHFRWYGHRLRPHPRRHRCSGLRYHRHHHRRYLHRHRCFHHGTDFQQFRAGCHCPEGGQPVRRNGAGADRRIRQ